MPCFKGLAVSIHTPTTPLSEYAVQRSSRLSRISSYIPVPPARIPANDPSKEPEQSTFAISITLLTPGLDVPYSAPKATPEDPYPQPKTVGGLPGFSSDRGLCATHVRPYIPLTTSPNETIAAYIYFDGRPKEEVATLLRRGEETWVNSRWVGIPESEGGGLAEREFLFREVGLERWLNGLDLDGKDAATTIERRRQKLERKRRKRRAKRNMSDDEAEAEHVLETKRRVLKDGVSQGSPLDDMSDEDDEVDLSGTLSESDDDPIPETAGQIKVALFRVVASGEIKRGEYSPQFDAHDDDEESHRSGQAEKGEGRNEADVDHTTSFAEPKSLDPKSISTQTVTGIDATDKPYAVFTFLYRGERQLQKMGILSPPKTDVVTAPSKRKSLNAEFASLGPLKKEGTTGFSTFRDHETRPKPRRKGSKKEEADAMDSDSDDEGQEASVKVEEDEEIDDRKVNDLLSPEDAERTGELAEGVRKIKLKRQHSAEPMNAGSGPEGRKPSKSATPSATSTPSIGNDLSTTPPMPPGAATPALAQNAVNGADGGSAVVGSPMKKQRASMGGADANIAKGRLVGGIGMGSSNLAEVLGSMGDSKGQDKGRSIVDQGNGMHHFGGAVVKQAGPDKSDEKL